MPRYRYKAKNSAGRTLTGEESVASERELVMELGRRRLTVFSIEKVLENKKPSRGIFNKLFTKRKKVKTFDLIILCRQLATLLQGGVPILNGMRTIASEIKNPTFKEILLEVTEKVRGGKNLSESLKGYPNVFSLLFVSIVEAGEKVGSLEKMLQRLGSYMEARDRLMGKIRSATSYPIFIAGFFVIAIAGITLFLVPRFESIYDAFGADLPAVTKIVFKISGFLVEKFFIIASVMTACIVYLVFLVKNTRKGKMVFGKLLLKLPIFGDVIQKAAVSKFCRTLSTLMEQGIPVTESLLLVGKTAGSVVIEDASNKASELIIEGATIPDALQKTGVFPSLMLQMVSVGVESGSLPALMDKTADFYEDQVDAFVNTLTTMIEPIMIISLGLIVAVTVVALYAPIFKLGTAMTGGL